jgi:hypothetical protein
VVDLRRFAAWITTTSAVPIRRSRTTISAPTGSSSSIRTMPPYYAPFDPGYPYEDAYCDPWSSYYSPQLCYCG